MSGSRPWSRCCAGRDKKWKASIFHQKGNKKEWKSSKLVLQFAGQIPVLDRARTVSCRAFVSNHTQSPAMVQAVAHFPHVTCGNRILHSGSRSHHTHRTRPALRSWNERQMRCFLMQPGGSCDIKDTCRIACTGISLPPRSPRFAPNRQIWFVPIGPQ